eukprot:SAG31_NODE_42653_length_270_cov_1.087719_1_plen_21_part_01
MSKFLSRNHSVRLPPTIAQNM